ncbi:MAG: hypothetical protein AAF499_07960 [Pseudomonadota bacterium]
MSEKEVPVLTDVVKRGNEDVIKAARLEREIFDELNRMAPREHKVGSPKPHRSGDSGSSDEGSLEQAVERIVEYHSNAMREELLQLLRDRSR